MRYHSTLLVPGREVSLINRMLTRGTAYPDEPKEATLARYTIPFDNGQQVVVAVINEAAGPSLTATLIGKGDEILFRERCTPPPLNQEYKCSDGDDLYVAIIARQAYHAADEAALLRFTRKADECPFCASQAVYSATPRWQQTRVTCNLQCLDCEGRWETAYEAVATRTLASPQRNVLLSASRNGQVAPVAPAAAKKATKPPARRAKKAARG